MYWCTAYALRGIQIQFMQAQTISEPLNKNLPVEKQNAYRQMVEDKTIRQFPNETNHYK